MKMTIFFRSSRITTRSFLHSKCLILAKWSVNFVSLSSFNHDKMKKLIDYITVMPDEDASHDVGHK